MPTIQKPTLRQLPADVRKAYRTFNEKQFKASLDDLPSKAQAALKKWAGSNLDAAEFAAKVVDGKKTFAAYVPSTDSGDVRVVSETGKALADGTIQDGNRTFDWNKLG